MRNNDERSTFEAEQEILAILSHMSIKNTKADEEERETAVSDQYDDTDAIPAAPDTTPTDIPLILTPDFGEEKRVPVGKKEQKENELEKAIVSEAQALVSDTSELAADQPSPFAKIGNGLRRLFPKKGDTASEVVRKCIFLLSLVVFLVSLGFLSYYMVLEPNEVNKENDSYIALFNDTKGNTIVETNEQTKDIQPSFRQLYGVNKDVAGWLAFNSTDSDGFMKINLPVVWCGDNETYLSRGFDGQYSRSGTLFFEQTNTFKKDTQNKVTIVYGHNMASGAMFAPLNKLIGNVYRARSAATLKLDTLYDSAQYKVFAVLVSDEDADVAHRFGYLRTAFIDDADFTNYVNELRARSLFDYPVDVQPNDELLILSTCTNKSQVKVANGRFAVVARRVREGESATTDTAKIAKNEDVIMPYAWYTAQSLTPHAFYTQADFVIPGTETANGTTTAQDTVTTTATGETDKTTENTSAGTTANTSKTTTDGTTVTTTDQTTKAEQSTTNEQTTTTETDTIPTT